MAIKRKPDEYTVALDDLREAWRKLDAVNTYIDMTTSRYTRTLGAKETEMLSQGRAEFHACLLAAAKIIKKKRAT